MNSEFRPKFPWLSYCGLGLVVLAYLGAIGNTLHHEQEVVFADRKVITITHWQLEAGFREALDQMIVKFEQQHPDLKVVQNAIAGVAYRQWLQTNLIGGTAPDLIQFGRMVDEGAVGRYCLPLSSSVYEVNEYNAGNEFRDTPWIQTFTDGLKSCWNDEQLEYFTVGFNVHTIRMFYNKTLFRSILGREDPPRNYEELLEICRQVAAFARQAKQPIYPIAASDWQAKVLGGYLACSLLSSYIPKVDLNFDGRADWDEEFISYLESRYDFGDPEIEAAFEMYKEVAAYFQPGFMSIKHQDSAFSFTQGRALMITSGSWDAWSFKSQVEAAGYELGVFDFPLPGPDHPRYGRYYDGKYSESLGGLGSAFAINRATRHPQEALQFLRFMTAKENNEEFSRLCHWIPAIKHAGIDEFMKPFAPHQDGVPSCGYNLMGFGDPSRTLDTFQRRFASYISRPDLSYNQFHRELEGPAVPDGIYDFYQHVQRYSDALRQIGHQQSFYAVQAAIQAAAPGTGGGPSPRADSLFRFTYLTDSAAALFMNKQARLMQVKRTAGRDQGRARALREAPYYREFVARFLEGNH